MPNFSSTPETENSLCFSAASSTCSYTAEVNLPVCLLPFLRFQGHPSYHAIHVSGVQFP